MKLQFLKNLWTHIYYYIYSLRMHEFRRLLSGVQPGLLYGR